MIEQSRFIPQKLGPVGVGAIGINRLSLRTQAVDCAGAHGTTLSFLRRLLLRDRLGDGACGITRCARRSVAGYGCAGTATGTHEVVGQKVRGTRRGWENRILNRELSPRLEYNVERRSRAGVSRQC